MTAVGAYNRQNRKSGERGGKIMGAGNEEREREEQQRPFNGL